MAGLGHPSHQADHEDMLRFLSWSCALDTATLQAQTWVLHRVFSNGALHWFPFPAVNYINYIINIAFLWARSAPNLSLALGETTFKFLSTKALIGFELHGSPKTQNVGTHTYVLPSIAGFDLLILHLSPQMNDSSKFKLTSIWVFLKGTKLDLLLFSTWNNSVWLMFLYLPSKD